MEYREREIDLINLLWKIAFAWRWCLVAALVCAILVPGVKYYKDLSSYNESLNKQEEVQTVKNTMSKEEQKALLTKNLKADEKAAVEMAVISTKDYNDALKYLNTSPVMQIDAYNEQVYNLDYYLDSGYVNDANGVNKDSYTNSVLAAYCSLVNDGAVAENAARLEGNMYTVSQLQEMITAEYVESVIKVDIIAPDAALRERLAGVVRDTFAANSDKIASDIGSHSIVVMSEYQTTRVDNDLLTKQKEAKSRLTTAKTAVDTNKKNLKDSQLTAYNNRVALDEEETSTNMSNANATSTTTDASSSETLAKPSFSIKYAVLGFIIGILVVAVIVALIDILGGKLNSAAELKDVFGIRSLYIIRKEKHYKGIDAWLYKMRYKNKRNNTAEESIEHFITNISLLLKGKELDRIYVTGTKVDALENATRDVLINGLGKEGISVEFGDNVCVDQNSLVKADEAKAVLVVEGIGTSSFNNICQEFTTFNQHEIDVVGGVVIE